MKNVKTLNGFCYTAQFSHSVASNSATPWTVAHRPPCPSPTPGTCSNSCPLSWWCHPTILSSVVPFSSSLQSFPAPGSFPMSQIFATGDQSIGASASTLVLPMNIQDWLISFRIDWLDLLAIQATLKSLLQHHRSKASIHTPRNWTQISCIAGKLFTSWATGEALNFLACMFNF